MLFTRVVHTAIICLLVWAADAAAQSTCPSDGGCLEPHGNPGCSNQECCEAICGLDPFCCDSWDATCVAYANASCTGLCGADASGSCFTPHPNPACNDATCCDAVCFLDPYCCQGSWDSGCVFLAGFSCASSGGECGDPQAGDCFEANGSPACSDQSCCEAVCDLEPRCCDVVWDAICVAIAEAACLGTCEVQAPKGAYLETEDCETSTNDPCHGGMAEPLGDATAFAGSFQQDHDEDVFGFDTTSLDLDGDGLVRIRLIAISEVTADLSIGVEDCIATPTILTSLPRCIDESIDVCIPAAPLWIRLSTAESAPPCDSISYSVTFEIRDTCDESCGTGGSCLEPRMDPGCEDPVCCELVCSLDPTCCEWEWDSDCAVLAATECGGPPPNNDDCADAILAPLGATPFRTLLATLDGPTDWCGPNDSATFDVWFSHRVTCGGTLYLSTCAAADFDTVIEVFRGDCDTGLSPIGCEDDSIGCPGGTSLLQVADAVCGETLMIRVLGAEPPGGNGSLIIDCFGPTCPCPADLDGDGRVGGSDLGRLFSDWGPCGRNCKGDLDGDGTVGGSDLGLLFSAWGDC
jgi:hypothetical protein